MTQVSVIVPVYNTGRYLRQCLDSIIGQTLKDIEVILVDDGSTDDSLTILEEYAQADGRVCVLHQENRYAGCARNLGLSTAHGKYVIFWDADDFFEESALEKLVKEAEEKDADLTICNAWRLDEESSLPYRDNSYLFKKRLPNKRPFSREDMPQYLFNFCANVPWNKLFLRSFVEENKLRFMPLRQANDAYFVMMALFLARRISVVDERLVYYRMNTTGGLTANRSRTRECVIEAFKEVLADLNGRDGFSPQIRQSFDNKALGVFFQNLQAQTDLDSYSSLHRLYREEVFPFFGLYSHPEEYYYNEMHAKNLALLQNATLDQWLLEQAGLHDRREKQRTVALSQCKLELEREIKRRKGYEREFAWLLNNPLYRLLKRVRRRLLRKRAGS